MVSFSSAAFRQIASGHLNKMMVALAGGRLAFVEDVRAMSAFRSKADGRNRRAVARFLRPAGPANGPSKLLMALNFVVARRR